MAVSESGPPLPDYHQKPLQRSARHIPDFLQLKQLLNYIDPRQFFGK